MRTGSEVEQSKPEMSIEVAIEQDEIIFEDNDTEGFGQYLSRLMDDRNEKSYVYPYNIMLGILQSPK